MRSLLAFSLLLLVGCGPDGSSDASDPASVAAESSGGDRYPDDLAPCDLLTPTLAAEAMGVAESDVELNDAATQVLPNICTYDAGDQTASVSITELHDSAEAATTAFSLAHRALTDAEAQQATDVARDAISDMEADGEIDADIAEQASDAADIIGGMAANIGFEPLDGVGDQAVVSLFRGQFNNVSVQHGRLVFDVSVDTGVEDLEQNRDPSIALARALTASR